MKRARRARRALYNILMDVLLGWPALMVLVAFDCAHALAAWVRSRR